MNKSILLNGLFLTLTFLLTTQAFAIIDTKDLKELNATGSYTQSLHVVNLLANTNLAEPGMTATPIIVKYYNDNGYTCWTNTLNFLDEVIIHAGPTQGCKNKVTQVIIMPLMVADKLKTYVGPVTIDIDTNKYSSHLTIVQKQAPIFDGQSGLVVAPGGMQLQLAAD